MEPQRQLREGILANATFPSLMYSILSHRETGVLTLTGDVAEKSVYIQAGRPVFATSSDRGDRLGQVLFRAGKVSLEGLVDSLKVSLNSGKRLGTVLVENGQIEPHDLIEGVQTQIRTIVCGLFRWTRGRYRYQPGPLPSDEMITLKLNAAAITLAGVRQIDCWERVWDAVGGMDARYRTSAEGADLAKELELSLEEWTLLSHCERPLPLRDICKLSPLNDFEICRLLWALLILGVVTRVPPGRN
jgi:hypothetical protein